MVGKDADNMVWENGDVPNVAEEKGCDMSAMMRFEEAVQTIYVGESCSLGKPLVCKSLNAVVVPGNSTATPPVHNLHLIPLPATESSEKNAAIPVNSTINCAVLVEPGLVVRDQCTGKAQKRLCRLWAVASPTLSST